MNITQARKLVKLLKTTLEMPESNFNMDRYVDGGQPHLTKTPACGTTLCFWGNAPWAWPNLFSWEEGGVINKKNGRVTFYDGFACNFFGISTRESEQIFGSTGRSRIHNHEDLQNAVFHVLNQNGYKVERGQVKKLPKVVNSL